MRSMIKILLNLTRSQFSCGYTLIELLIAVFLTSIVASGSGYAWLTMINTNKQANAKSAILFNVNRAAEFIQDEIKHSQYIESNAVSAVASITNFTLPPAAIPVLVLKTTEGHDIVYYTQPVSNPWLGPNAIYRWGYSVDGNGNYDTSQSPSSQILIDNIDNQPTTINCPPDSQASNTNAVKGFFACIQSNRLAHFFIHTSVSHSLGKNSNYGIQTSAFTRSETSASFSEFTLNNNQLILQKAAKVRLEILGGSAQCYANSPQIPIDTYVNITYETTHSYSVTQNTPASFSSLPAGTTINIETTVHWECQSTTVVNTATENVMVKALRDGDNVPPTTPALANQETINVFLRNYIDNGKIKLADNQVIYLFEMYGNNTSASYFDLQDNVVLATIENP